MPATAVSRKSVARIVEATFPAYRGRKIRVEHADKVHIFDLNWSGGSRSQYRACTLDGAPLGGLDKYNAMAPWRNPAEGAALPIAPGAVVVRHSMFCGKDAGLTIYFNRADLLPSA